MKNKVLNKCTPVENFFFVKTCICTLINKRIYNQKKKKVEQLVCYNPLIIDPKSVSFMCVCITGVCWFYF